MLDLHDHNLTKMRQVVPELSCSVVEFFTCFALSSFDFVAVIVHLQGFFRVAHTTERSGSNHILHTVVSCPTCGLSFRALEQNVAR